MNYKDAKEILGVQKLSDLKSDKEVLTLQKQLSKFTASTKKEIHDLYQKYAGIKDKYNRMYSKETPELHSVWKAFENNYGNLLGELDSLNLNINDIIEKINDLEKREKIILKEKEKEDKARKVVKKFYEDDEPF